MTPGEACVAALFALTPYADWPVAPFGIEDIAQWNAPPEVVAERACAGLAGDANAECRERLSAINLECRPQRDDPSLIDPADDPA